MAADLCGVDTTELAWAAGVFDAEGSVSTYLPRGRRSRARQIAVYQSGTAGPPQLLVRFQHAVGGRGRIHGPARGSLYQWHSKRHDVVEPVGALLWPWLGEVKRAQLRAAAAAVGRPFVEPAPAAWSATEQQAWAAGFFDGEGTIRLEGPTGRRSIGLSVPQATRDGVPDVLVRFRDAVGAGRISRARQPASPWSRLPQHRWELRRQSEVAAVIALLRPYCDVVKRGQMDHCLAQVAPQDRRVGRLR